MTDRYYSLTVILDREIREDDCEPLIEAIKMLRGVRQVKPHITTPDIYFAQETARMDLRKKLFDILMEGE